MVFRTILIVDSDHDTRISLRRIFESAGHFVISASGGVEAIMMLEKVSVPSIVLVATNSVMRSGEKFLSRFLKFDHYAKVPAIQIKRSADDPDLPNTCATLIPPITKELALATLKYCE